MEEIEHQCHGGRDPGQYGRQRKATVSVWRASWRKQILRLKDIQEFAERKGRTRGKNFVYVFQGERIAWGMGNRVYCVFSEMFVIHISQIILKKRPQGG